MTNLRIAMIGCGAIARFHAPALVEAGFEISAVAGSPDSGRVKDFAGEFGIPDAYGDPGELIDRSSGLDGILICASVAPTLDLLRSAMDTGLPVLVEKPISFDSESLRSLAGSNAPVLVAYNRRFYDSADHARREVLGEKNALAQLIVPEAVRPPDHPSDAPEYLMPFFANSVHGLDMARSVLGNLTLAHVERSYNIGGALTGLAAILRADSGAILQFTANWGAPANFSLTIDHGNQRYEMKPFEAATTYEGMDVVEPTTEMPLRTYVPRVSGSVPPSSDDVKFKPGFVAQARSFAALIQGGDTEPAARLSDAYAVLKLAEELTGTTMPGD
jgi:predicted dehydrogenase